MLLITLKSAGNPAGFFYDTLCADNYYQKVNTCHAVMTSTPPSNSMTALHNPTISLKPHIGGRLVNATKP